MKNLIKKNTVTTKGNQMSLLKNSFTSSLITEVNIHDNNKSKERKISEISSKNIIKQESCSSEQNEKSFLTNEKHFNKKPGTSFFKAKSNFEQPKHELLDYFMKNQTEYLDMYKYEEFYKNEVINQNMKYSIQKQQIKEKQNKFEELNANINKIAMDNYKFSTNDIEDDYCKIIQKMNEKM